MSIPIYLISCHSALCVNYAQCGTPTRADIGSGIPIFKIPKSTYILNFTAGGEYCLFNAYKAFLTKENRSEFRKLLFINDRDDISRSDKPFPFVGQVMRAAAIDYPNISCIFREKGINDLGVFDLDKTSVFLNENSIIKATEEGPYNDVVGTWYLDDIIAKTYKHAETNKGIFIFAGCSSPLVTAKSVQHLTSAIGKSIDTAQQMIYLAETSYSTLKPTLSRDKIPPGLIAHNVGYPFRTAQPTATDEAGFAHALGEDIDPDLKGIDPANYETAQKILGNK